jgi:uncharacterized protein YbbC (DUF1343 family)
MRSGMWDMKKRWSYLLLVICSLFILVTLGACGERVRTGSEVLIEKHLGLLAGKRVGIICNHTSLLSNGTHIVDTLVHLGVNVTALFGPEHGIRGISSAGENVESNVDARTGLPVYSLYGKVKKPTAEMLANVDVLLFDIQDVGARFYTYASTMAYAMEAAGEHKKKIVILDRPNPINGVDVEGPVLDTAFKSFIGLFPIPIRHGLTLGELAKMIVGEKWMNGALDVDLTIIQMENWKRAMWYDETGLPWIAPSPNMKTLATATVYPGTCLFEGTTVTEGRGTMYPFEYIGAPWIQGDSLAQALNSLHLSGVQFESMDFTPKPDSIAALNPKYKDRLCHGVMFHVTNRSSFQPVIAGVSAMYQIGLMYADSLRMYESSFDRLSGTKRLREVLVRHMSREDVHQQFLPLLEEYKLKRQSYLLY